MVISISETAINFSTYDVGLSRYISECLKYSIDDTLKTKKKHAYFMNIYNIYS